MLITIKKIERSTYSLNEDGELTCDHEFAEVTPPCCSTGRDALGNIDCGCYGEYSVYCPDCDYMNMPDTEVNELIEASIGEPDYE